MEFQFVNKDVAEQFETDFVKNPFVRVPKHHMGKLSTITLSTAEALIKMGSNLVRRKTETEPAKRPAKETKPTV